MVFVYTGYTLITIRLSILSCYFIISVFAIDNNIFIIATFMLPIVVGLYLLRLALVFIDFLLLFIHIIIHILVISKFHSNFSLTKINLIIDSSYSMVITNIVLI